MSCYTVIFDCYDWLPSYGEYAIVIHPRGKGCDKKNHGGCIVVDIYYDNQNDETNGEYPFAKRSYIFKFVSCFYQGIWSYERGGLYPVCPRTPCHTKEDNLFLNVLYETNHSLLAKQWDEYWKKRGYNENKNRQFTQHFRDAGTLIDVICEDVELTDETLVKTAEWEWERL